MHTSGVCYESILLSDLSAGPPCSQVSPFFLNLFTVRHYMHSSLFHCSVLIQVLKKSFLSLSLSSCVLASKVASGGNSNSYLAGVQGLNHPGVN